MAKLDPYSALFNQHVNDAGKRAMSVLEEHFPPSWSDEIRAFQAAGIMSIFDQRDPGPSPATAAYLALVTAFVNENEGG